ncbi:MAG TPA: LPS export ABC transporter periplasmic protein LptC [Spirochaetota bacterium]|nr:LPS export ABC transporter periplasmic protein LptC [Spirochaetota bacterium]HNT10881.1 LPS export ABC transporter periplasmic protein LptC [Spirochaetota bacterium]HNV45941.1 LPS export ABC transporter periplasmic protein LptC [Spirochaetota bacterium]HOS41054.1 LPS export ABC transporter periplasmic protein LptC [Spirochaetota bacterium]HPI23744.1 LPS export ABC transporter periplasmic protein LptC [Spirochaetota bacterium]
MKVFARIGPAVALCVACVACGQGGFLSPARAIPDMRIKNFQSTNYQNGKLLWELAAEESLYFFSENRSVARGIVVSYYQNNKLTATVRADEARIVANSRNIVLSGNVDALMPSGNRLVTSSITWNNHDKVLDTDDPVRIVMSNGDVIEGIGLKANYDLETFELKRRVTAKATETDAIIPNKPHAKKR